MNDSDDSVKKLTRTSYVATPCVGVATGAALLAYSPGHLPEKLEEGGGLRGHWDRQDLVQVVVHGRSCLLWGGASFL